MMLLCSFNNIHPNSIDIHDDMHDLFKPQQFVNMHMSGAHKLGSLIGWAIYTLDH